MTATLEALFSLASEVALVTGASRGLGFEIARAMAGAGARVVLAGRDEARLDAAAARIAAEGHSAGTAVFDLTDAAAMRDALGGIVARYGKLDILVSNAGTRNRKALAAFEDAELQGMIDANLTGSYRLAREAARHMVQHQKGRIIVVTSIAGQVARPNDAVYAGVKHGLTGMMRALAVEYGRHGITSNAIAPGGFATEANAALKASPEANALFATRTALGRWGEPSEIAGAAVFLASPAASYVTGHVLTVDGGFTVVM